MENGGAGACSLTASSAAKITSDLFEAYLKCPTKCWLRATGEPETGNLYSEWVKSQSESFRVTGTERLLAETPAGEAVRALPEDLKTSKWRLAVAVEVAVATPALPRIRRCEDARASVTSPSTLNSPPTRSDRHHLRRYEQKGCFSFHNRQSAICNRISPPRRRAHALRRSRPRRAVHPDAIRLHG